MLPCIGICKRQIGLYQYQHKISKIYRYTTCISIGNIGKIDHLGIYISMGKNVQTFIGIGISMNARANRYRQNNNGLKTPPPAHQPEKVYLGQDLTRLP